MDRAVFEERIDDIAGNGEGADGRTRLRRLFDLWWEWLMTQHPEAATRTGYPGQNSRWTDWSLEAVAARREALAAPLRALETIDHGRLGEADRLDFDLFRRRVEEDLEESRFPVEFLQVDQLRGLQVRIPLLLAAMPAATVAHYEDLLSRLRGVPRLVEQTIVLLERGLAAGVTPPAVTLRDVPGQIRNLRGETPGASPLLEHFRRLPAEIPPQESARLVPAAHEILIGLVLPALDRLHDYLVRAYIPHARATTAQSDLPDGAAWYAFNVRRSTTTDLTPAEIHEIGREEVRRILAQMEQAAARAGFPGDLPGLTKFLATDPRFFFADARELLAAYRDIAKRADPELVKLFGKLPRLPYGVKAVPAFAERSQPTAYYEPGSREAGRPAWFFANTYDLGIRPRWEMEALTLHEAVPGHHLQIALAEELHELPLFRRHGFFTAYVEGWGLYAESLGEEMGFYQDPYSLFGRLVYELWRAIRLVVDTGLHALGWSREQAIGYFEAVSGRTGHDVVVEVDRYIVWPGQALAYKIGELKIRELRTHGRRELGERFDLRAFHDQLLGSGALPLDVLDARLRAWVAARKTQRSGTEG